MSEQEIKDQEFKLNQELGKIWEKYKSEFKDIDLERIVERGFVFSVIEKCSDVLICRINPSFIEGDSKESYPFNFKETNNTKKENRYYLKFHELLKKWELKIEYTDLFYQRHTKQPEIVKFLKNEQGIEFLFNQLSVTQDRIENLKPKLILVFNKGSRGFWGIENKENGGKSKKKVWMGYKFKEFKGIPDTYQIKGWLDSNERVNHEKKEDTKLVGTLVYFSKYYNERTREKQAIKEKINSDLEKLMEHFRFDKKV